MNHLDRKEICNRNDGIVCIVRCPVFCVLCPMPQTVKMLNWWAVGPLALLMQLPKMRPEILFFWDQAEVSMFWMSEPGFASKNFGNQNTGNCERAFLPVRQTLCGRR